MENTPNKLIATANPGETFDDFVRRLVMEKERGTFQFNNFVFELTGGEGFKEYCIINAEFWLSSAKNAK